MIKDKLTAITFGRAGEREVASIKRFLVHMWQETYGTFLPRRTIQKILALWHTPELISFQMEDPDFFFGVLRDDAGIDIIGLVTVKKSAEGVLSIDRLYVHPRFQRQGFGKRLLDYSLGMFPCSRKFRVEVFKGNGKALNFYAGQGFAVVGTKQDKVEDVLLDAIVMEKELDRRSRFR